MGIRALAEGTFVSHFEIPVEKARDSSVFQGLLIGRDSIHVSHLEFINDNLFCLQVVDDN